MDTNKNEALVLVTSGASGNISDTIFKKSIPNKTFSRIMNAVGGAFDTVDAALKNRDYSSSTAFIGVTLANLKGLGINTITMIGPEHMKERLETEVPKKVLAGLKINVIEIHPEG